MEAGSTSGVTEGPQPTPPGLSVLLAPVRGRLVVAGVIQIIGGLAGLLPYIAVVGIAREVLAPSIDPGEVWRWTVVAAVGLALRTACTGVAYTVTHLADADVGLHLRRVLTRHLGQVPLGWFGERSSGRVKRILQDDVHAIHHVVAHGINDLVAGLVAPVAVIGYLLFVDWQLALVCLVPVLVYFLAYGWMMRDGEAQMARWSEALGRLNATLVEFVEGIAVVKAFGQARDAQNRYRKVGDELADFFGRWVGPMLRVQTAAALLISPPLMLLYILAAGTWFVGQDWIAPVDVLPFVLLGVGLGAPMLTLGFGAQAMRTAGEAAQRVAGLLETPTLERLDPLRAPAGHRVEFSGVSFSYDGRTDVLTDIDLVLEPGTVTALVGASGSGKSTLARLLPRFWDVSAGSITVGGVDVRQIAPEEMYRQFSFVFQDNVLLRTSVRDNIRLARPQADDAEVEAAASAAQAHDFITRLPRGYDSVVHQDAHLSGGEAQRVCIARALLADTPVLVLDEATAFADPESEAAVQDALSTLVSGRTLLVIGHRLHTITAADRIVVLSDGRIVEAGRHEELLAARGRYAQMWAVQAGGHDGVRAHQHDQGALR